MRAQRGPPPPPAPRCALTPPGARVPRRLRAAEGEAAGLAERPAEVLVHHGADVPLEVGEEDTAGADVLGLGGSLLLGAAVLLLDAGRGVAGEGAAGAGAAAALRGFLHFGVKGELLQGRKENGAGHAAHQGALARPVPAGVQRRALSRGLSEGMQKTGPRLPAVPSAHTAIPTPPYSPL